MIRRDIHEIWEKCKVKLYTLLGIIAIIMFFVVLFQTYFSNQKNSTKETNITPSSYQPRDTVIKGIDVTEKSYEEDKNTIDKFIECCKFGNLDDAYNMLTDECKKNTYATKYQFEEEFYDDIFGDASRQYNIQSWVNNSEYTVYKLRVIDNILATGDYESSVKYETYITTYSDNEKVSIGEYVNTKSINKTTKSDLLEATVVSKTVYLEQEEYEIKIKNLSNKIILLTDVDNNGSIELMSDAGNYYREYQENLLEDDFIVNPQATKTIKLKFNKDISISSESNRIILNNIITDYNLYKNNKGNYELEKEKIIIKL